MHRTLIHLSALLASALLGVACSTNGTADTQQDNAPDTTTPGGIAVQAVAEKLSIAPDEVEVASVDAVNFSDSSLGCPEPGMSYLQVITPGHKVMVEYADRTYDVRISKQRALICDQRSAQEADSSKR